MRVSSRTSRLASRYLLFILLSFNCWTLSHAQGDKIDVPSPEATSRATPPAESARPTSQNYRRVQQRLARGWNTWDVNSVMTQVLLPEGLAIHIGLRHNATGSGIAFLSDALIGKQAPGAEQVLPGPHTWDGRYTDLRVSWKGHSWRVQSALDGNDLVLLAGPLPSKPISALPPTIVISVNFLWDRPGTTIRRRDYIATHGVSGAIPVYCTSTRSYTLDKLASPMRADNAEDVNIPIWGPYFSTDFTHPVGISTGKNRTLSDIEAVVERQRDAYQKSISGLGKSSQIVDALETTLGWDTIFEPEGRRVISPVSRVWSVGRGGYVLFEWDTFFASTMASIGDRDLAYANAIEMLRELTAQGFVPNYARPSGWKSTDRSEPPIGSITVLALYRKFHDRWLLDETFEPLFRWNRWWMLHRDIQGYLTWGSDGDNKPDNLDDGNRGTRMGAILESGLDNSPMYDDAAYNSESHLLEFADVGLLSMYIADCDALAAMADILEKPEEARELRDRSLRYRSKLQSLWDEKTGMFLNKDLHTGRLSYRLSPTNFYPLLARAATPSQAERMIQEHLLNPREFWGKWVIPSIAIDDPAFCEQNYWRGRIWGPMNYLVYLGLSNYDYPAVRQDFAARSLSLFLKEWGDNRHVHENYNAVTGTGDDVTSSDRFYHWGALLCYIDYLERARTGNAAVPLE